MADRNKTSVIIDAVDKTRAGVDSAKKNLSGLESSANSLNSSVARLAPLLGAATFVGMVKGSIDAADNMNDLSKETGIAVEELSAWKLAAESSGTSAETISKSLQKLSVNMAGNREQFKALGINGKTTSESFLQLAGVLERVADVDQRNALGTKLLGKSYLELKPLLSEGEAGLRKMLETGQQYSTITQEMADESDKFNDQLAILQLQGTSAGVTLAKELLPSLNQITAEFIRGTKEGGLFKGMLLGIGNIGKSALFGSDAENNKSRAQFGIPAEMAKIAAQLQYGTDENRNSLDFAGRKRLELELQSLAREKNNLEKQLGLVQDVAGNKPAVDPDAVTNILDNSVASKKTAAAEKLKNSYDSLIKKSGDYLTAIKYENAEGETLSEGQKTASELRLFLATNTGKLTKAQTDNIASVIGQVVAEDNYKNATADKKERIAAWVEYQIQLNEANKAHTDGLVEATRVYDDLVSSENDQLKNIQDQINVLTYGAVATQQMENARLLEAAAAFEQNAAYAEQNGVSDENIKSMRDRAQALRDLADARSTVANKQVELDQLKKLKDLADDTWRSLGDGLTNALFRGFEKGKGFGENFFDSLKNLAKTTVIKFASEILINPIKGTVTSAFGNVMSSFAGGFGGSAQTPGEKAAAGMGGNMSGLTAGSSIYSAITQGFTKMSNAYFTGIAKFGQSVANIGLDKLGNFITVNSAIIGKALPYAGAIVSLLQGDVKGAALTAVGVAIGNMIVPGIGGVIGGMLGSMVGGMFGSHVPRPKYYANATVSGDGTKLLNSYMNDDGKSGNQVATSAAGGIGAQLLQYAQLFEGTVKKFTLGVQYQQKYDSYLLTLGKPIGDGSGKDIFFKSSESAGGVANAFVIAVKKGLIDLPDYLESVLSRKGASGTLRLDNLGQIKSIYEALDDLPPVFNAVKLSIENFSTTSKDSLESLKTQLQAFSTYTDLFYTDAEKTATLRKQLSGQIGDLGLVLPETREGFRALVDGIDASTVAGYGQVNALVNLAAAADAYYSRLEEGSKAATEAMNELIDSLMGTSKFATLTDYLQYKGVVKNYGAEFAADYTANLRTGRIVTDASGKTTTAGGGTDVVAELKAMRADQNSLMLTVAQNTADTAKMLRRWEVIGQPDVRV